MLRSRNVKETDRKALGFIIRFSVTIVVFYLFVAYKPVDEHFIVPMTARICQASALLLRVFGEPVEVSGTTIRSPQFAVDVKNGCNGLEAVLVLVAAVIAFPARAKMRLVGIAAGVALIQIINLVRIASLFWLGAHHPAIFNMFHLAVWQSLIILVSVGIFLVWSGSLARQSATAHS